MTTKLLRANQTFLFKPEVKRHVLDREERGREPRWEQLPKDARREATMLLARLLRGVADARGATHD